MSALRRLASFLLLTALPLQAAVNRSVSIQAPAEAAAGSTVSVTISARTDASDGEQIAFLHSEYSIDEGRTWTQFCYEEKSGPELSRQGEFAVNAEGGKAIIRVRVAFRGGSAGDVDYQGGAIRWSDSWQKWRWPPAKYAVIKVPAPPVVVRPPPVKRTIGIEAPAEAAPGSKVVVTVSASTEAGGGEQIGFLHAEYSIDEGRTWTQFCFAEKSGAAISRQTVFAINAKGGKAIVRVRVAFRDGAAGDVDYRGGAIQWDGSWEQWHAPAAKYAIIYSPKS